MDEHNDTHTAPQDHWDELARTAPDIPDAPAVNPRDIDWQTLGEYDWHYTVATGHFGDNEPEIDIARAQRDRIRATFHTSTQTNSVPTSTATSRAPTPSCGPAFDPATQRNRT